VNTSDVQCKDGYSGVVCRICAKNFVSIGNDCNYCEGGASLLAAFSGILVILFFVFLSVVCIFLHLNFETAAAPGATKGNSKGNQVFGQIKIMISFLQIVSSVPIVFRKVPWPDSFVSLTLPLTFINFDFMRVISAASCKTAVGFHFQFIVHMSLPVLMVIAVISAYAVANVVKKAKTKLEKKQRQSQLIKIILMSIILLYPSLGKLMPIFFVFFLFFFCSLLFNLTNIFSM
jgi:hypothetical protein